MPRAWSEKRERQYEHIKDQAEDRGEPEKRAEEIAARTVNKERARAGEAEHASRLSVSRDHFVVKSDGFADRRGQFLTAGSD